MKTYIKSLVAALLCVATIITTYVPTVVVSTAAAQTYSKSSNSGERNEVCTSLDGTGAINYYKGSNEYDTLSNKSRQEVFNALQSLMRSTHSYISSYNDCHYKANITDCENNDTSKLSLIYTSYSATQSQWNGWNREHVWPQSLGGNNTSGGGADLHHIRPSDAVVNSTRGNKKYGYAGGGSAVYGKNPATGYLGGYSGTYYEPVDAVKGDVARICLYVYVRWNSDWGASDITKVFQSVDVLLEWCALDPVDTWEMGRNEVIEDIQGNRNVFIDYPEYAWIIFGKEVPSDMVTPSGEAMGGNQGGNQGGTDTPVTPPTPVCTHSTTVIKGSVNADCHNEGYTGDVHCASCDKLISSGTIVPSTNAHNFGPWAVTSDSSVYARHCSTCGIEQILTVDTIVASIGSDAERIMMLMLMGSVDSALLESLSK